MFKTSLALRNSQLEAMAAEMDGGVIKIYDDSGSIPANAEDAIGSSVLLVTVSNNGTGTGITFESSAAAGIIQKKTTETWKGTYVAAGTLSFYRYVSLADDGSADDTAHRMQGEIGLLNADMNVSTMVRGIGEEQEINTYIVGQPAYAS